MLGHRPTPGAGRAAREGEPELTHHLGIPGDIPCRHDAGAVQGDIQGRLREVVQPHRPPSPPEELRGFLGVHGCRHPGGMPQPSRPPAQPLRMSVQPERHFAAFQRQRLRPVGQVAQAAYIHALEISPDQQRSAPVTIDLLCQRLGLQIRHQQLTHLVRQRHSGQDAAQVRFAGRLVLGVD